MLKSLNTSTTVVQAMSPAITIKIQKLADEFEGLCSARFIITSGDRIGMIYGPCIKLHILKCSQMLVNAQIKYGSE